MRLLWAIVVIAASTFSFPAVAHGLTPGPIGIYFAALHTLTEMPLPLVLVSIGLLFGLNKDLAISQTGLFFLFGVAGGVTGILVWQFYIFPILPLLSLAAIGALWAASGVRLPQFAAAVLAAITGYFAGVLFAPGPAPLLMQAYAIAGGTIGALLAVFGTQLIVASVIHRWSFIWIKLAFRVVASWLAAIAVMVAALSVQ